MVRYEAQDGSQEVGEKEYGAPLGRPEAEKVTGKRAPLTYEIDTGTLTVPPSATDCAAMGWMLKSELGTEITATMNMCCAVPPFGSLTAAVTV